MSLICKQIILISALFLLSSCKSYVVSEQDINSVKNNEKALVVLAARINNYDDKYYSPANVIWCNISTKSRNDILCNTGSKRHLKNYNLCYYFLEPGEYKVKAIASVISTSDATIDSTLYINKLIKFSVKGGEVIYLGDATFYHNKEQIAYKIIDNYDQVYIEAQKLFPSLQTRITKRLLNN